MACGYNCSSSWTIILIAILVNKSFVFSLNTSVTNIISDPYEQSFTNITLKKCCWKNIPHDTANNDCTNVLNITWEILSLYRVPKDGGISSFIIPAPIQQKTLFQNILSCKENNEHNRHLQVPVWKEFGTANGTKLFSSFFSQDGNFQYKEYSFSPEEYCVDSVMPEVINIVACDYSSYCAKESNKEDKKPCLFRCCNYGEVWDISGSSIRCADSGNHKWKLPQFYDINSNDVLTSEENESQEDIVILTSHPRDIRKNCKTKYTFQISNPKIHEDENLNRRFGQHPFKVLVNGTVWIKTRKREWAQLNPGEYCIDGYQIGEGNYSGNHATDSLIFECKSPEKAQEGIQRQMKFSLSFGIIISFCVLFLLMTTIVYILLWSQHNIHGWTVFSYITSILITYVLVGISYFAQLILVREQIPGKTYSLTFCGLLGILCHFSFLCTFSWSTVLSFDLFCTFRTLRPTRNGKSNGLKRFLLYCLFAFTVPTIIVTIGILLDITYSTDVHSDVITPNYGKSLCYVHSARYARIYFIILPISVLLGINFLLFCNTAYFVYNVKKSTQFASSSSTKKETDTQTVRLILKLLIVSGSVWVVEIISWCFQKSDLELGFLSFILDVANVLQAVAIFFLFVFKNDILESLRKTYPSLEDAVNMAFKLKNCGSRQHSRQQDVSIRVTTSTDASYKIKVDKNMPVTTL